MMNKRYGKLILLVLVFWLPPSFAQNRHCEALLRAFGVQAKEAITHVPAIDNEPEMFRRTYITESQRAAAIKKLAVAETSQLPSAAFEIYLNLRLSSYSIFFKRRARNFIKERVETTDSEGIGACTVKFKDLDFGVLGRWIIDPYFLAVGVNPTLKDAAVYYSVLVHELEHFIQFNDSRYGNLKNLSTRERYNMEFGATYAEWEYWRLIPNAVLVSNRALVKNLPIDK